MKNKNFVRQLVLAAVCLALCMVLPLLTGQIPSVGKALSPMHIPVLLCGFLCGAPMAAAVGFLAPLLRFVIFGMPPIFPTGLAMAFELAAYGVFSALLYQALPKKVLSIYLALIGAMIAGRVIWGIVMWIIMGITGAGFTFAAFLSGSVLGSVPGIICHIALIPLIVMALEKAGYTTK